MKKNEVTTSMNQNINRNELTTTSNKRKQFSDMLTKMKPQIANALPKHLSPERIIRIALTAVSKTPALLECSQNSLLGAIIQSSQLGLEPDGALGEAYIIPYYNGKTKMKEAQFQVGYRGLIALSRRSGEIISINANAVREGDEFDYQFGTEEFLRHKPCENRGKIKYVYAYSKLKDGGHCFIVMSKLEIDKIRAISKASNSGPWTNHYEEMAKKTAIKRLSKLLPMSIEYREAVSSDDKIHDLSGSPEIDMDVSPIHMTEAEDVTEPEPAKEKTDLEKTIEQEHGKVTKGQPMDLGI